MKKPQGCVVKTHTGVAVAPSADVTTTLVADPIRRRMVVVRW
jgi:hypothetical protein